MSEFFATSFAFIKFVRNAYMLSMYLKNKVFVLYNLYEKEKTNIMKLAPLLTKLCFCENKFIS